MPGNTLHPGRDIGNDRRIDKAVAEKEYPGKVGNQPNTESDIGEGREEINCDGYPEIDVTPARGRIKKISQRTALLAGLFKRADNGPDTNYTDGKPQADAKTHVEIKVVGKNSINRTHALVPTVQNTLLPEDGVEYDGDDKTNESADDSPEG